MSISAVKGILWVAGAIAAVMFFAAQSAAFDRNESLALVLGAAILAIATTLWYRRAMPAAETREEARRAEQLETLKQQITLTRQPIPVRTSSGVLFLSLLGCATAYFAWTAWVSPGAVSILLFAFTLAVTVGLALLYAPRIGKPALTIRADGLEVPVVGFFRWDEIESVGLQTYTSRGATTHSLDLYVPQLRQREDRLSPLLRLARRAFLRAGGNFVVIQLLRPSLPPALVHSLCYDLWKQATGRSKAWTSLVSADHLEEVRRGEEQLATLERIGAMAETDPTEALRRLDELQKRYPANKPQPQKRLGGAAAKRRDALAADLRAIDVRDAAARKRLLEKHATAYSRDLATKLVILAVALVAVAVVASYFLS